MADNTYEVQKDESGRILTVLADKPILDPNHPDAVQVLDQVSSNALGSSSEDQVVSTRDDGTVSVGGNTVETGQNPVTAVEYDNDGNVQSSSTAKSTTSAKKSD